MIKIIKTTPVPMRKSGVIVSGLNQNHRFNGGFDLSDCNDIKKLSGNGNDYLCKVRLDYGAELLKSGKYDVTQVCYNCGYKNLSHFTCSFKKQYGVTPGTVNKARHLK